MTRRRSIQLEVKRWALSVRDQANAYADILDPKRMGQHEGAKLLDAVSIAARNTSMGYGLMVSR